MLSVLDDVPVDNETHVVTSSIMRFLVDFKKLQDLLRFISWGHKAISTRFVLIFQIERELLLSNISSLKIEHLH